MREIQIIGNLTRDAEVKRLDSGRTVINFDVAVNESWRDKGTNEKKERTSYFKCALWRDNPTVADFLLKGIKVYVRGVPEAEAYVNKEGKPAGNVKIIVHNNATGLILLSRKNDGQAQSQGTSSSNNDTLVPTPDDDLPF